LLDLRGLLLRGGEGRGGKGERRAGKGKGRGGDDRGGRRGENSLVLYLLSLLIALRPD